MRAAALRDAPRRHDGREGGLDHPEHLHQIGPEAGTLLAVQVLDPIGQLHRLGQGAAGVVLEDLAQERDRAAVIVPPHDAPRHAV